MSAEVYAIGKVVKAGRQLIVCEVKVYTAANDKYARAFEK